MKQDRLALYRVDMKYVRDLHNKDDKVSSVSPQIGKETRVYVGIIVVCDKQKYCVPLSHAEQKKHEEMKGSVDFSKIYDEKNKLIAVLNFNLMIPVEETQLQKVDVKINPNDTEKVKHYKKLCQSELNWCQKHSDDIVNKANVLYKMYRDNVNFKARKRCVNFAKLEDVCKKYNEKHTQQHSPKDKEVLKEKDSISFKKPFLVKIFSGYTKASKGKLIHSEIIQEFSLKYAIKTAEKLAEGHYYEVEPVVLEHDDSEKSKLKEKEKSDKDNKGKPKKDKINIKNMIAEKSSIVDKSHTSVQKNRNRGDDVL
ncbi:MAG: type III toxin-antitoxin system ToxN/AbiQ family toxin [Lachnospiraceae bacterium]|nr:type III toxin-antitoxin system ToxN/AbiQ family toxin [Lachnospiraceae bacterium]